MPAINFPSGFFLNKSTAKPLENGKLYIGGVNLDPTVEANRISITIIQQNGTPVTILPNQQPLTLNAAGMIVYSGSVVQARTEGNCSLAIHDENDVPQYYFPSASASADVTASLIQLAVQGSNPTPVAGSGWLYTKNDDGIAALYFMNSAGGVIQLTKGSSINVDFPTSVVTALQLIAEEEVKGAQFVGLPQTLEIIGGNVTCNIAAGTTFSLTLDENVTNFNIVGMDAAKALSIGIEIINTGTFTITNFVPNVSGWDIYIPNGATLQPASNAITSYGVMIFPAQRMHIFPVLMDEQI